MGIQLDFDLPAEPVILPFDGEKLSIALFALISNACLFCEEGRNSIRIAVSGLNSQRSFAIAHHTNKRLALERIGVC